MKIKIYVINLARSVMRKKHIAKQLKNCGIDYSFVVAVDGKNKKQSDFKDYNPDTINITGKELKATEIGAFMSHIKAIKTAKKENVDWAIILEDDVVVSSHFKDIITHIENATPYTDCIRMYVRGAGLANSPTTIKERTTFTNWGGALGYAINRVGLDKVLGTCDNFSMKIDNFLFGYWLHGLKIYQVNKNLVDIEPNIDSDIGYSKSDKPKSKLLVRLKYKLKSKIMACLN